jgi:hypothetical protein
MGVIMIQIDFELIGKHITDLNKIVAVSIKDNIDKKKYKMDATIDEILEIDFLIQIKHNIEEANNYLEKLKRFEGRNVDKVIR